MTDVPQRPAEGGVEHGLMSCDDPIVCQRGSQLPEASFTSDARSPSRLTAVPACRRLVIYCFSNGGAAIEQALVRLLASEQRWETCTRHSVFVSPCAPCILQAGLFPAELCSRGSQHALLAKLSAAAAHGH